MLQCRKDGAVNDQFRDQISIRHLGMGEQLVALAMADDWANEEPF